MLLQIFDNRIKLWQYLIVWILFALLQAFSIRSMVVLDFAVLLGDAFVHALLYAFSSVLLWNAIKYSHVSSLSIFQTIFNYLAFIVLALAFSLGLGLAFDSLLGSEITAVFLPFLPLRGLLTFFIYVVVILIFKLNATKDTSEEILEQEEEMVKNENWIEIEALERIAVKLGQKIHLILVPDILYIQADGDYVHIVTETGKYMKELTMKRLSESLPSALFVRVHRSFIVNVEAISRIELYEKQSQQLTLKNGDRIKTSQAGYKLLKEKLNL